MRVNLFYEKGIPENYIDFHYDVLSEQEEMAYHFLESLGNQILGKNPKEETTRIITPNEILYMEVVDRKSFVYLKDSVWQVNDTLSNFLSLHQKSGFSRIGKSCVVNIYHVKKLKAELNMKVLLVLDNGEQLILNRAYRKKFFVHINRLSKGGNI